MTKGKVDALLGIVFGDEGKGKVVDYFTPQYDVVARFAGGPNAGHTIIFDGKKFVLRSIPSGIFCEGKINIIGNGCVLAPDLFMAEANELEAAGYDIKSRLHISKRAHLILPTHRALDRAYEAAKGKNRIGTTGKGPTYSDKAARTGLRVGDILCNFEEKYAAVKARHEQILRNMGYEYDIADEEKLWMKGVEYMKTFPLTDSENELNALLQEGKSVLAEGAQGTMLDIDHGTYPMVSSSSTTTGGVCTGLGVPPSRIADVFGIFKAYSTRVGSGPFPVELFDATGDRIREIGHEYGAVTGRNRRCGWLDLVALKYAVQVNGVTQLIMMKSDVLDGFPTIKVCTAYRSLTADRSTAKQSRELAFAVGEAGANLASKFENEESTLTEVPYDLGGCEAVYEELPGWHTDITGATSYDQLPQALRDYVKFIEDYIGIPVTIVSVGPDRNATIVRS